jgi:hypothetical protein
VDKTDDLHGTAKFFKVNRPTTVVFKCVVVHKEGGVLFILIVPKVFAVYLIIHRHFRFIRHLDV